MNAVHFPSGSFLDGNEDEKMGVVNKIENKVDSLTCPAVTPIRDTTMAHCTIGDRGSRGGQHIGRGRDRAHQQRNKN